MKQQWTLIFALLFALVIAVFSVVNVSPVPVDYVFGTAELPLILVILGSALAGGLAVGLFGTIRMVRQNRRIRALERELQALKKAASAAPAEPDPGAAGTADTAGAAESESELPAASSGAAAADAPETGGGPHDIRAHPAEADGQTGGSRET